MADKSFGVKQINLIGASGTPTIESPNNLNLNANTVAISTDVTVGGQVQSNLRVGSSYFVGIGTTTSSSKLDVIGNVRVTGVSTLGIGVTVSGTTFTNQLSVSGFSTFAGITTIAGQTLFAKQLNVSGVSTFAGITTITGTTLFAKQLNVSGISTFGGALVSQVQNYNTIMSSAGFTADGPEGRYLSLAYQTNPNYILNNVGIGTTNSSNSKLTVKGNTSLETLNVSGVSTFNANVFFGDGDIAYFGDGQDLLIFHNSTDSIIRDNGTGDLFIQGGNGIKLTNPTGIETYAVFNQDGASELWFDNAKKFETTSSGSIVTGILTATSFSGSGSMQSRTVVSGLTTSIANNGIGNTNITGFKSYALLRVGLSTAAWLRLYTDSTSRANDASRSIGIDPAPGSGVIAEVVTTGISTTQIITPFTIGGNLDSPVSSTIYAAITNLSGSTQAINAQLTILQLEV